MTLHRSCIILQWVALTALVLTGSARATNLEGRGVHYFASSSGCPLPEVSTRAEMCNRIGLDDPATTKDFCAQLRGCSRRRHTEG